MPQAMPKQDPTLPVWQPEVPETAIDLPSDATGSPAIDLQRLLIARFSENGQLASATLPVQSQVARQIYDVISAMSRLAGPVLFLAALTGIVALIL